MTGIDIILSVHIVVFLTQRSTMTTLVQPVITSSALPSALFPDTDEVSVLATLTIPVLRWPVVALNDSSACAEGLKKRAVMT